MSQRTVTDCDLCKAPAKNKVAGVDVCDDCMGRPIRILLPVLNARAALAHGGSVRDYLDKAAVRK